MAATYRTIGLILTRRDWREADRRLEVFSQERGRLSLIARGVRKGGSKLAGRLEPFTLSELALAVGRQQDVVIGSEVEEYYPALKADPSAVALASLVAEAVVALLPSQQPDHRVFAGLTETLEQLNQPTLSRWHSRIAEAFLWKLLTWVGLPVELDVCAIDRQPLVPGQQGYLLDRGVVHAEHRADHPTVQSVSQQAITLLRLFRRATPSELAKVRATPAIDQETQRLVAGTLEFQAEQPFRSWTSVQAFAQEAVQ